MSPVALGVRERPTVTITVVAVVPPHLHAQVQAGKLVPVNVVFEQRGDGGLVAGAPQILPVRPFTPADAIRAVNRGMEQGQIVPVVAFTVPGQGSGPANGGA